MNSKYYFYILNCNDGTRYYGYASNLIGQKCQGFNSTIQGSITKKDEFTKITNFRKFRSH